MLTSELAGVPGFVYVADYTPNAGKPNPDDTQPGGDLLNWDYIDQNGGPADYNDILSRQKRGEIPDQSGPGGSPPGALDAQTNNNSGANASGEFTHSQTT